MLTADGQTYFDLVIQIAATILALVIVNTVVRYLINRAVKHWITREKVQGKEDVRQRAQTLERVFDAALLMVLWVIGLIAVLTELNVNLAALLTGAGLLGAIIGFGAQNTLKNLLAGAFIIAEDQYRIGDIIQAVDSNGPAGTVEDLGIRTTRLRDLDGNLHIIANGDMGIVTSFSAKFANANIDINVPYDTDIDKAMEIINQVGLEVAGDDKWKSVTIEPIQFYRVNSFNDYSVTLKCLGKVLPPNQWNMSADFRARLKKAFEKHDIELAIPQIIIREPKAKKR